MNALGRGLSSLIPKRNKAKAEDMLEKIDSMEVVGAEPPKVRQLKNMRQVEGKAPQIIKKQLDVVEVPEDEPDQSLLEKRTLKQANIQVEEEVEEEVEEVDDHPQEQPEDESQKETPSPTTPLVTPLTIDPETGVIKETVTPGVDVKEKITTKIAKTSTKINAKADRLPSVKAKIPVNKPVDKSLKKQPLTSASDPRVKSNSNADLGEKILPHEKVHQISTGDIEANALQPRRRFDADELEELVRSMDQHGLLQPIVITKNDTGDGYQLIAGERRLRAAKRLSWNTIGAVVRASIEGDRNRLELALVENIQRQNLDPVEEAMGYKRLHEEYGMTHEEIGNRVGRSRVGITNIIRILQLPAEILRGLSDAKITTGHARAILMIPDEEKQLRFYKHMLDEGLTVRKAENRARRIQRTMNITDPMRRKIRGRPKLAIKYDGLLQDKFDCNARVKFNTDKNRYEIIFYAHSEAEGVEIIEVLLGIKNLPENVAQDVVDD